MEVVIQSSYRTTQPYSAKRARSPDSTSGLAGERCQKRPALTECSSTLQNSPAEQGFLILSPSCSRHASEDWVQQAGGLRIASPHSSCDSFRDVASMQDEVMNVDEDLQQAGVDTMTFASVDEDSPEMHAESVDLAVVCEATDQPDGSEKSSSTQYDLSFVSGRSLQSQLPQTEVSTRHIGFGAPSHSKQPASEDVNSSVDRKQRFSMGPRANCEKCRSGVKGHWAHFD